VLPADAGGAHGWGRDPISHYIVLRDIVLRDIVLRDIVPWKIAPWEIAP
jgi:hypothetical protein